MDTLTNLLYDAYLRKHEECTKIEKEVKRLELELRLRLREAHVKNTGLPYPIRKEY
jgi:hypothetical protein